MQNLRNLPLAVRLGVAFGALALGLLVVSLVAFRSTDNLQTKVDALAVDVPQYTALVDGVAARLPEEAHLAVEHPYVHDGDLEAQDRVAGEFEKTAEADEEALAAMVRVLSAAGDAESVQAVDGVEQLQQSYLSYLAAARKAIELSRRETVGAEERTGSRTIYLEQIVPMHEALEHGVAEASKATLAHTAGRGDEAEDAIASTKRSIVIVALVSAGGARPRGPGDALGGAAGALAEQPPAVAERQLPHGARRRAGVLRGRRPDPRGHAGHEADPGALR
jgi:hypothetical protein